MPIQKAKRNCRLNFLGVGRILSALQRNAPRPAREAVGDAAAVEDERAQLLLAAGGSLDAPAARRHGRVVGLAVAGPFPAADADEVGQAPTPKCDGNAHWHSLPR